VLGVRVLREVVKKVVNFKGWSGRSKSRSSFFLRFFFLAPFWKLART
jgi:hypothetical protein